MDETEADSRTPLTVLVTGAAGFIGSHVVEALTARGDTVVGLDNVNDYYDPRIKRRNVEECERSPNFRFVERDIRDADRVAALFETHRFDRVVHLAAMAGVRPSIAQPALYMDVNVTGTTVLLETARKNAVDGFVLASSSSVYGARRDPPFREDDPPAPAASPYAASKQASERVGRTYAVLHGMDVTALRFFNAFGPRQRPDMAVHKFTRLMLAGEPIPFYGDGSSRRDHTYVGDIVAGVVRATDRAPGRGYRVYNLGNSATVTLRELVESLEELWGVEARLDRMPDQPGDVPLTCADISRSREELGFEPATSFRDGLRHFREWYGATVAT